MNNDIVAGFDEGKNDSITLKLKKIESVENGLIVYASGYIDTYNSLHFRDSIEKAIETGFVRIVFELHAVQYISSTGIATFPHFLKLLKSRNGDMILDQVQPRVYEVFELLGLTQFLTFKNSLEESLAHFSEVQAPAFPRVFSCPVCEKRLKAPRAGRFRCSECKAILVVDAATSVMLG